MDFPIQISRPAIHHCEPDWSWSPAPFTDFDLWIVLEGRGILRFACGEVPIGAGSGIVFQPGEVIAGTQDAGSPLVVFACHFYLRQGASRLGDERLVCQMDDPPFLRASCEAAVRAYDREEKSLSLATAQVLQLLCLVLFHHGRPVRIQREDFRLRSLAMEIQSNPGLRWDAVGMAQRCSLSVPHFNRKFRAAMGFSPMRYVIRQRVRRAIQLLRETQMTIQQIADALGYADALFFHRQFRRLTDQTPGRVRSGGQTSFDEDSPVSHS